MEKSVVVSLNHGHLYLLLGEAWGWGGDDHVCSGLTGSPGLGVGGWGRSNRGVRVKICGYFFYFLLVPSCDTF